jgi:flagellin-like protein
MRQGSQGSRRPNRGVSPVIGVIMMILVTVLLGATIGTFATGLGSELSEKRPQATFDVEFRDAPPGGNDTLAFVHDGGDSIAGYRLEFVVTDARVAESDGASDRLEVEAPSRWIDVVGVSEDVSAGQSALLGPEDFEHPASGRDVRQGVNLDGDAEYAGVQLDDATVRLVWVSDDSSMVLAKWSSGE